MRRQHSSHKPARQTRRVRENRRILTGQPYREQRRSVTDCFSVKNGGEKVGCGGPRVSGPPDQCILYSYTDAR